jgi:hypothetical protein
MSRSNHHTEPVSDDALAEVEFKEGLKWLEEHGTVLIIPASRTRDNQRRTYLLRDRDGRSLVDVHDPLWIRNQERSLGLPRGWLARRIKSLTERGWLAPEKGGRP